MAYTKQTWANGDVITAEKLNHMEDGIAGGTLVIGGFSIGDNIESIVGTSDKTWQEIYDAFVAGKECVAILHNDDTARRAMIGLAAYDNEAGIYYIQGEFGAQCDSPDGYPSIALGEIGAPADGGAHNS